MKKSITILLFLLSASLVHAQNDTRMREVYVQAESDYQVGRIEQAREALMENLSSFHGNLRQNALHLIALSHLASYDIKQTEQYAKQLLQENPYYTPSSNDPAAFVDIINSIKAGMTATITTASSQAESLAEVPVPTTLITAEMIEFSGARNLQEVLAAYVPGMNIIDCNDDINIAMRGIYSNTQEKILIMLNGHRMNSFATNTSAPDYSVSLEKIKQIEVLRGPASSLYGGVALTAVVNIITKQGADVDGMQAKATTGNHGQIKVDALFGKRYFDIDMLIWGSVYRNSGEKYNVTNERKGESQVSMPVDYVRIGRVGDHPTYDFGLQLGYKGIQFMYDTHFSQIVSPFTLASLALSYDYDRYRTFNGLAPCFSVYSHHADLSYSHKLGDLSLKVSATYDKSDLTRYQVVSDAAVPTLSLILPLPEAMLDMFTNSGGLSRYVNGQEQDYGFQLKGNYAYTLGDDHKGNIGFGAEFDHFQLDDFRYQIGYNFEETLPESPTLRDAGIGRENSADAYLQLKHQWRSFILNAGMRYDYKSRYDHSKIRELSPRIALILLRPKWSVRLSYSKSFVDAPYIYRKANVMTTLMSESSADPIPLSPERVHSFQLSFAGNNWKKGFDFEINGFYNRATDLILTSLLDYSNASQNKTCGVELMASYKQPQFSANWNLTWTHTFRSNLIDLGLPEALSADYSNIIDTNNNTPAIMSNLVLGWQATPQLKLHTHLCFEGRQESFNADLEKYIHSYVSYYQYLTYESMGMTEQADAAWKEALSTVKYVTLHKEMSPRAILNLGGEYALGNITFGLNIHNLLGTRYYRSGMNTNIIPQQGRWFTASIGIKI